MTSSSIVLDGYNVIRRDPELARMEKEDGLEAGRLALLSRIRASSVLRSSSVTVVFDGSSEPSPSPATGHPRLRVLFSTPPDSADDTIVKLAQRRADQGVEVVTADRDLAWRIRKLGGTVVAPERWGVNPPIRRGKRRRRGGSWRGNSPEKPSPSRAEVDWGLSVFGDGSVEAPSASGEEEE